MGGMLSGKAGLVHIHMGSGKAKLQPLHEALAMSDVPITQFLPTHMGRNPELVTAGIEWLELEGHLDFTAGQEVIWFFKPAVSWETGISVPGGCKPQPARTSG